MSNGPASPILPGHPSCIKRTTGRDGDVRPTASVSLSPRSPPPGPRGDQVAVWNCSSDPIPDPAALLEVLQVALAYCVVVAFGIRLDFELCQFFFRGVLEVVMQVHHRCGGVTLGSWTKDEPQPVGQVHEASNYMCHKSHPLP
jgi:hypothetical protein